MKVLVVTVVHTPLDARIHRREIAALLDAGHEVVFAAPLSGYGLTPADIDPRLGTVDLPRAVRRRRLRALVAARRLVRQAVGRYDVVVLHDPELLLAVLGLSRRLPVVWDVHEDLATSFADKPWLPAAVRPILRAMVRLAERWAEGRAHLLLAEQGYADRFRRSHELIPNLPPLIADPRGPVDDRVVYVGRVSRLRGAVELAAVGERLAAEGIRMDVLGPVDGDVRALLEDADAAGHLRLHGFVPNDRALAVADGALAGLSLLHDHPNYRHSMPTKVVEYQALGIPVVTTPLPAARDVVETAGSGVVVPFEDVDSVVGAVLTLHRDRARAATLGAAGREDAERGRSWDAVAPRFVAAIERAGRSRT